ncbi:MAG: MFS transporter [Erysipelotrichia bacterium]|nr:MFS transporter [Erysipelotrichia bacterium]
MKKLSSYELLMIAVNCIFTLCSQMSSVFMNVYLYTYTGSLVVMAVYTAVRIGIYPLFFTLAGKIAVKHGYSRPLTLGLVILTAQLLEVLLLNSFFDAYPILIYIAALLCGMGESFYWCSVNSLNQLVSDMEDRTWFLSIIGIFSNIMSICAPVISGIIIAGSPNDTVGCVTIFKAVLVIYIILAIIAFQVKVNNKSQNFSVIHCLSLSGHRSQDRLWKVNSISTFLFGVSNSLALMLSGLLVYNAVGSSGSLYSTLLSVFAVLTVIGYAMCSRTLTKERVISSYVCSSWWTAASTIVLVLLPNLYGALFFGFASSLSTGYYWNCYSLIGMEAIGEYEKTENITGRVIARETYLAAGRCLGMGVIVLAWYILPENAYLTVSVLIISVFSILASAVMKRGYPKKDGV